MWIHVFSFIVTDENSDSESEIEERAKGRVSLIPFSCQYFCSVYFTLTSITVLHLTSSLPAHRQRLVSVKSILSQPSQAQVPYNSSSTRKRSLEQELHQRKLFEYFLVVSLQKSKAGGHYLPEVTQQFPPKVSLQGLLELLIINHWIISF